MQGVSGFLYAVLSKRQIQKCQINLLKSAPLSSKCRREINGFYSGFGWQIIGCHGTHKQNPIARCLTATPYVHDYTCALYLERLMGKIGVLPCVFAEFRAAQTEFRCQLSTANLHARENLCFPYLDRIAEIQYNIITAEKPPRTNAKRQR